MRLISYLHDGQEAIGALRDDELIVSLTAVAPDMLNFIELGRPALLQAAALLEKSTAALPLTAVTLRAPIPQPRRNVMCLGKNYAEHAAESHRAWGEKHELPEFPVVFTKATTAVSGPYDDIPFDTAVSQDIDYEAELAVIIGSAGKNISRSDALAHVFGYMVLNDATARDMQRRHKQYFKGKSLDGHCPTGPWIVTADALADPSHLRVVCRVNGETRQDGNTSQMIFDIPETIAQLSRGMTLLPGDIIATGTPSGVGFARTPPVFLRPGDVVECEVESVGVIRNRVTAVA